MEINCHACKKETNDRNYVNQIFETVFHKKVDETNVDEIKSEDFSTYLKEVRYYCSNEHLDKDRFDALCEPQYKGNFYVMSKSIDDQVKNNDKSSVLSM